MILVVGATGSLGGRIARDLLTQGHSVRAFVRAAADARALRSAGADIASGDLTDAASIARACDGIHTVITTASASNRPHDSVDDVDLHGNLRLIDSAREAGVHHVIFASTLAASEESPVPVFRAKAAAERRLRESGMTFTILHANGYMDVWFPMLIEAAVMQNRPVTLVGESRRRHSFIAERDVAAFAVAALKHAHARNATIVLGGPEAVSFRDVVAAYETALGRTIQVMSVAPGEPIPGLPEPVWGIAAALETYDSPVPMHDTARTFDIELTSALDFARSRAARLMGLSASGA